MSSKVDVAIIGSGFSGSILAWILAKQGRRVALIDYASHPRFAIGESSTPIADLQLQRLGDQYAIDPLKALSTYGSWQREFPEVTCGKKRGFSYYVHASDEPFSERPNHDRSLLVAASACDDVADTQWYRSEVDQFLFRGAVSAGALDYSGYAVENIVPGDDKQLVLSAANGRAALRSDWIIDASGRACVTGRLLRGNVRTSELRTRTHSSFAHYRHVGKWSDCLLSHGHDLSSDPFDGDDAAQHHLLDDGWLWMLRFDNQITSVGYTTSLDSPLPSIAEIVARYPSIRDMFGSAEAVEPMSGNHVSGRLQRWIDAVVSDRIVMLPSAAVTIDPLHSTGIAHALAGVERIAAIILADNKHEESNQLDRYRANVNDEARFLDRLVHTAYQTMHDFPRFTAACMIYFAGAIACEERYQAGDMPAQLWNADEQAFVAMTKVICERLIRDESVDVRSAIKPWNHAGLANETANNRYAYTATKR